MGPSRNGEQPWLMARKGVGTSVLQPQELKLANHPKELASEFFPRASR